MTGSRCDLNDEEAAPLFRAKHLKPRRSVCAGSSRSSGNMTRVPSQFERRDGSLLRRSARGRKRMAGTGLEPGTRRRMLGRLLRLGSPATGRPGMDADVCRRRRSRLGARSAEWCRSASQRQPTRELMPPTLRGRAQRSSRPANRALTRKVTIARAMMPRRTSRGASPVRATIAPKKTAIHVAGFIPDNVNSTRDRLVLGWNQRYRRTGERRSRVRALYCQVGGESSGA